VKKYSSSELEDLDKLAHQSFKFSISDIKDMISEYKIKIKNFE
jgi:hypothetical protein